MCRKSKSQLTLLCLSVAQGQEPEGWNPLRGHPGKWDLLEASEWPAFFSRPPRGPWEPFRGSNGPWAGWGFRDPKLLQRRELRGPQGAPNLWTSEPGSAPWQCVPPLGPQLICLCKFQNDCVLCNFYDIASQSIFCNRDVIFMKLILKTKSCVCTNYCLAGVSTHSILWSHFSVFLSHLRYRFSRCWVSQTWGCSNDP